MKLNKTNDLFTHLCGERVTNREVMNVVLFLAGFLVILGLVGGME